VDLALSRRAAEQHAVRSFDIRIHAIRHRRNRRPFEVRWHAAGRIWSKSLIARGLADSYRALLVRAARRGVAFDPGTRGASMLGRQPASHQSWYRYAVGYTAMKWPPARQPALHHPSARSGH